jgi:hypothetical protein
MPIRYTTIRFNNKLDWHRAGKVKIMTQMIIHMPDDERQKFISAMDGVFDEAKKHADECVKLLVGLFGLDETKIKRDVFEEVAISRICSGTLKTPRDRLREAVFHYKLSVLGLDDVKVDRTYQNTEIVVQLPNGEAERFFGGIGTRRKSDREFIIRTVLLRLGQSN